MTPLKTYVFIPFLGCLLLINVVNGYNKEFLNCTRDSTYATYQYRDSDGFSGTDISLNYNKNFYYSTGTDLQQFFSKGTWFIIKDTLILRSSIQKDEIPITIKVVSEEPQDSLIIDQVKNMNQDIVKDATVYFNNDTLKRCMPVFNECTAIRHGIRKIKLTFNNNALTKWHELGNIENGKIQVIVNVDFSLDNYKFLADKKYLIKKEGLYELREEVSNINGKENILLIKESLLFYKRIK